MELSDLVAATAEAHRGRKFVIAISVSAGIAALAKTLDEWGATGSVGVCATAGVGEQPDIPVYITHTAATSLMDGIRRFETAITAPDQATQAFVDEFDPNREALVITEPFNPRTHVLGRRIFGARRPEWLALEDKTVVDRFWDEAGVARAPSRVVAVADAPTVAKEMASDHGTVWAADNKEGWHGGASYTRWIPDATAAAEAVVWFGDHADAVRVMPFLEGIPCSIHGYVGSEGIAAFRPVEMLIFRTPDHRFFYAGPASFWDPPAAIREQMRAAARSTAVHLRDSVGYLGPFSIDGVCTSDGFLPTELNPRYSAGLGLQANSLDFPFGSITRALVHGDISVPAEILEAEVLPLADATRSGGMGMPIQQVVEPAAIGVVFDGDRARRVEEGQGWGDLKIGPTVGGSYLMLRLDPAHVDAGPSLASKAVSAAQLASRVWDLDLPDFAPAADVCAGR